MVYDTKTFETCHALTEAGKEQHQKILEEAGSDILLKNQNFFKWLLKKLVDFIFD